MKIIMGGLLNTNLFYHSLTKLNRAALILVVVLLECALITRKKEVVFNFGLI